MNDESVYLNKAINHTIDNDIEKGDIVVAIHLKNEVNANEEYLSETNSLNE